MTTSAQADWRKAIERAGGVQAAVLYGPALEALVKRVEELEKDGGETMLRNVGAMESYARQASEAGAREREMREDLRLEREALVEARRELDAAKLRLGLASAVVSAARLEIERGAPSQQLIDAIAKHDQEAR